ncbi:retron St85 family effector protein [Paraburkholderia caffeinilytica]|uniref:retron St85 family effector protein n=1 Tax=Paraburkholderia caffeinilytica TaxID=1761016 RepID=UPI003DA09CC1
MSDTGSPLVQLIETVDPKGCHLFNLPNRIWVFGGPVAESTSHPCLSLRDSFWRQQLASFEQRPWFKYLDRPENHPGWWAFSGYDNLLEFERDACYLASRAILFSESPGSYAELGALALDNAILPRLFVVVQAKFLEDDRRQSFLNLGPIKRVDLQGSKCVIGSPHERSLPTEDFDAIVDSVDAAFDDRPHGKVALHANNPTHRLLLIADLVDLLLVSKIADLQQAITHFGISLPDEELKRALGLLAFFGLVRFELRGTEPFWTRSTSSAAPWVDYTAAAGQVHFDRTRFKIHCQEWISTDNRRRSIFERTK